MQDFIFRHAAAYANRGIPVVVTHGIKDDNSCTCGRASCTGGSRGKHPVALRWQDHATTDEDTLIEQLDTDDPRNIGILLGPQGGVIDIEFDDEEGAATVKELGLDKHITPTYTSGRSVHRLYKYDSRLPSKAVVKYRGLEVRLGSGGMAAQSIMPPSVHYSGTVYEWKESLSLEDLDPMQLPEDLLELILKGVAEERPAAPPISVARDGVKAGDRHNQMVRLAAKQAFRMRDLNDPSELADQLDLLFAINEARVSPPLPRQEVEAALTSAVGYALSKKKIDVTKIDVEVERYAAEAEKPENLGCVAGLGLERRTDGWYPGSWRLVVVHSVPPVWNLVVAVPSEGGWQEAIVELSAEEFKSASKVALKILEATHGAVNVDRVPGVWQTMWNGKRKSRKDEGEAGLYTRLVEACEHAAPSPESSRDVIVASAVLDLLVALPEADDVPADHIDLPADGSPSWVVVDGQTCLAVVPTVLWNLVAKNLRDLSASDKRLWREQVVGYAGEQWEPFNPAKKPISRWVLLKPAHIKAVELAADGRLTTRGKLNRWT